MNKEDILNKLLENYKPKIIVQDDIIIQQLLVKDELANYQYVPFYNMTFDDKIAYLHEKVGHYSVKIYKGSKIKHIGVLMGAGYFDGKIFSNVLKENNGASITHLKTASMIDSKTTIINCVSNYIFFKKIVTRNDAIKNSFISFLKKNSLKNI